MTPPPSQVRLSRTGDEVAIRSIPFQIMDAWNCGSGPGLAAPFTEAAEFVAFEGTHLHGRSEIAAFHQRLFETDLKGSRLEGSVRFVRFLAPDTAVLYAVGSTSLPEQSRTSPGREWMQMYVLRNRNGLWMAEALLDARRLTPGQQEFRDSIDVLSDDDRDRVTDFVATLRQRAQSRGA